MNYFILLLFTFNAIGAYGQASGLATHLMRSPDNKIAATLSLENGQLSYSVAAKGKSVIGPSALGLTVNKKIYGSNVTKLNANPRYERSIAGTNAYEYNVWNGAETWCLQFQLFNNGCAFRYVFKGGPDRTVNSEQTIFSLPKSADVWFFERDNDWKLKSYAGLWMRTNADSLSTISKMGPIQGKPLIAALPENDYLLLTEAGLYNYSGMRLKAIGNRKLQVNFTEEAQGFKVEGQLITPWRVILFAAGLNELVNNHVIEALNPKPDPVLYKDQDYIKPGRSVWSWITKDAHYMEPAREMEFIDAASALKFEYSLIDEGWESKWPDKWQQLKDLCAYAAKKNVKIWVWKHSDGLRNSTQRDLFLDSLSSCGVAGLKTDFMNSEAKSLIDFEIELLKASAKRRLMVNFHGCQAPTGEAVAYPNEMTREGIRGIELNTMNEPIPAWHNAALPFTRFITGHGDYTPGLFSNKGNTTYTHQLCLLYLFDSPFQCIAENPVTLLKNQRYGAILPFLRELPTIWDETMVLPGSAIGKLAAFARRKGDVWYVAVINGAENAVDFSFTPSFLKKGETYEASIVSDQKDGKGFKRAGQKTERSKKMNFNLLPAGGLLIKLTNTNNRNDFL